MFQETQAAAPTAHRLVWPLAIKRLGSKHRHDVQIVTAASFPPARFFHNLFLTPHHQKTVDLQQSQMAHFHIVIASFLFIH